MLAVFRIGASGRIALVKTWFLRFPNAPLVNFEVLELGARIIADHNEMTVEIASTL